VPRNRAKPGFVVGSSRSPVPGPIDHHLRPWLEPQRRAERYRRHQAWTSWRRASALDAFFIGRSGGSRNNRLWPQFLAVGALNARRQPGAEPEGAARSPLALSALGSNNRARTRSRRQPTSRRRVLARHTDGRTLQTENPGRRDCSPLVWPAARRPR